jgi:hypothetical protein
MSTATMTWCPELATREGGGNAARTGGRAWGTGPLIRSYKRVGCTTTRRTLPGGALPHVTTVCPR